MYLTNLSKEKLEEKVLREIQELLQKYGYGEAPAQAEPMTRKSMKVNKRYKK